MPLQVLWAEQMNERVQGVEKEVGHVQQIRTAVLGILAIVPANSRASV